MEEKIDRNNEIFRLWNEDRMTFAAIGNRYNLTRERVRQIVKRHLNRLILDVEKDLRLSI